jgi:hypothetical protein
MSNLALAGSCVLWGQGATVTGVVTDPASAVIPGVAFSADGRSSHAFVQVVPSGGQALYFAYPIGHFRWDSRDPYRVSIGTNTFDRHGIVLDLVDDGHSISGALRYGPWTPWPVTALSPGIMGWYRFVPRMETYHGVLSMDHSVTGSVSLDNEAVCFDGGRGYTEKDWGHSFPSSWIWAQSNSFDLRGTSIMLSVAKIPWMGGSFVGNIAGLLHDGSLHRFATYTGARVTALETGVNEARVVVADRRAELEVKLHGCETLVLKAPVLGAMEGRDAESLGGSVEVTLRTLRGGRAPVAFEGTGRQAGIEIMNDAGELQAGG